MEFVSIQLKHFHLLIGHLDPFGIWIAIQFTADLKPLPIGGRRDQIDNNFLPNRAVKPIRHSPAILN